jgi:[histone H3]-dimethyl-L-lysine9 demethylase
MKCYSKLFDTNRYLDTRKEVKKACPVCQRTCTCKVCLASESNGSESKDSESKVWHQTHVLFYLNNVSLIAYSDTSVFALLFQAYLSSKSRVDRILHFHYLICMLLPLLKRISENRETELATEAKIKGSNFHSFKMMFSEVS